MNNLPAINLLLYDNEFIRQYILTFFTVLENAHSKKFRFFFFFEVIKIVIYFINLFYSKLYSKFILKNLTDAIVSSFKIQF